MPRCSPAGTYLSHIDEQKFESLLDQVRELHRIADELTREPVRLHDHVRALLRWDRSAPTLPTEQREIAERAAEALSTPRLTSGQSRRLHREFFGR
jgi:hypothetical protein